MRSAFRFAALLPVLVIAALGTCQSLDIGSVAPPVKVAEWISGQQPNLRNGKVHVLTFISTWSVQSKGSFPTLNALAQKFRGKAEIAAVCVYEQARATNNAYIDKVRKFVQAQGQKMDFDVACDGFEGTMAKTWMQAAGQRGVPAAFVVGGDGKVLWIGHPLGGLEGTLDAIVGGTYSTEAAATNRKEQQNQQANAASLQQSYNALLARKDYRGAVAALDKIIVAVPSEKANLLVEKFTLMLFYDEAAAQKLGAEIGDGVCKDDGEALNTIAWAIVDPERPLKKPNLALAQRLAERSVTLLKGQDPYSMDTLAYAQFKLGKFDLAIQNGTKAVKLANASPEMDAKTKKDIAAHLAAFKKAKRQ